MKPRLVSKWTWTDVAGGWEIDAEGCPCALTLDSRNRPHIFFSNSSMAPHCYRYARWQDDHWRFHLIDRFIFQWGGSVSIAIGPSGKTHMAYVWPIDGEHAKLLYVSHNGGTKEDWIYNDDFNPLFCVLLLDSNEQPHIVFYDGTPRRNLHVWRRIGGQWETAAIDDTPQWAGWYPSAVIDEQDRIHVAYFDNSNTQLRYAVGSGSTWSWSVVDASPGIGYQPSLTLDPQQCPHITYTGNADTQDGPTELRYARFDGNVWQKEIITRKAVRASASALKLDSQGRPHVVWQHHVENDLYLSVKNGTRWDTEFLLPGSRYETIPVAVMDPTDCLHVAAGDRRDFWEMWLVYGRRSEPVPAIPVTTSKNYKPVSCLDGNGEVATDGRDQMRSSPVPQPELEPPQAKKRRPARRIKRGR